MEIANIAFLLERSGRRTVLGKHMKKRNLKDKVSGLLDEKRGKRSILGRYLNDVIRHSNYTKHEDETDKRPVTGQGNKNRTGRRYNGTGNFDDYMDLAYCAVSKSSSEASFSDSDEQYVRESGDGSETPDTEEYVTMDTVARGSFVYHDRIVIGAETYESRQTVLIDNRDDFIIRGNTRTGIRHRVEEKRSKKVGFVIADETDILENHRKDECALVSQKQPSGSFHVNRSGSAQLGQQVADKVCACGSEEMRMRERKLDQRLDAHDGVTSLKTVLKQKTKSKLKILLNMYKSRKSQLKISKKKSSAFKYTEDVNTEMIFEHETWNRSQADENTKRDSFNFAFCDESSRVVGPCDRQHLNSAFVPRNIGENLLFNDSNNRPTCQNEQSCVSLCGKSSREDFVYFNDGFIL